MFKPAAQFAVAVFLVATLAEAITIYIFDYFESSWGRDASMHVSVWVMAPLSALFAALHIAGQSLRAGVPRFGALGNCLSGVVATAPVIAIASVASPSAFETVGVLVVTLWAYLLLAPMAVGMISRRPATLS